MKYKACDPDTLQAYLRGDLDDESCSLVEAHAIECDNCRSVIELDLAGVAGALKTVIPEVDVPTTVHLRVNALARKGSWRRRTVAIASEGFSRLARRSGHRQHAVPPQSMGDTYGQPVDAVGGMISQVKKARAIAAVCFALLITATLLAQEALRAVPHPCILTVVLPAEHMAGGVDIVNLAISSVPPGGTEPPRIYSRSLRVRPDGTLPALTVDSGFLSIAAETEPGIHRGPRLSAMRVAAQPGSVTIRLSEVAYDSWAADLLRTPAGETGYVAYAPDDISNRSHNYFGPLRVSVNGQPIIDEKYRGLHEGSRDSRLTTLFPGYASFITMNAPGAQARPVLVNEALPNDNCIVGVQLDSASLPVGSKVEWETSVCVTNINKGAGIGLVNPWGAVNLREACVVHFDAGKVSLYTQNQPNRDNHVGRFEANVWQQLKVVYNVDHQRADVYLNGRVLSHGVQMHDPENTTGSFAYLILEGLNFAKY